VKAFFTRKGGIKMADNPNLVWLGTNHSPNYVYGGVTGIGGMGSGATGIGVTGASGMTGASMIGHTIYSVPDKQWYIVNPNLSITPFVFPNS
jgi:hypothetical protein